MCQYFIDFHDCVILHCVDELQFAYPFISWWTLWLFQSFGNCEKHYCEHFCIYLNTHFQFCWVDIPRSGIGGSVQFSSVTQSCPTLCNPMNRSTPGLPVHHHLPEFTQTHVHQVSDAIQPSHSLSSPSPPAPNSTQHQSLFQWVNSSHEVAKVLEFQL